MIPRIIHQTYKTQDLPERWKGTPETWKRNHPEWTYMFWTDHDNRELIKRVDPEFLPSYDAYKYPIQRADAVRYYILKHYGGIYVDLDMQANASFEPVFQAMERRNKTVALFSSGNALFGKLTSLTNSIMIAAPHTKHFDHVIQKLKQRSSYDYWFPHITIMKTTGPLLVNDTQRTHEVTVLTDFLLGCNVCKLQRQDSCITNNKYLKMMIGHSWHNLDSTLLNILYCHRVKTLIIIIMIVLYFRTCNTTNIPISPKIVMYR